MDDLQNGVLQTPAETEKTSLLKDQKGKYHWIYELPMRKSFFLLFEVWRVLLLAAAIVGIFMLIAGLITGNGFKDALLSLAVPAICLGIMLLLSIPAYWIVTKANNGKYTVLFEMDEEGIDHTQIKTDKAKALDFLTIMVGGLSNQATTTAAGALSATGGSLYSRFSNVGRIKSDPKKNLIRLNGPLVRNMIYVAPEDFAFVLDFIVKRCPNARVG
ncbi:MAG: hypothetical protein IJM50_05180 [Lachnospiraceae bacterium]|nr:hypothetical protein [Lachnospiraceae bacterium]